MAALSTDNLRQLIRDDKKAFATKIMPIITQKLPHMKNTEMQQYTAASLEEIASEQSSEDELLSKAWLLLCETLIDHLTAYNKKALDDIWTAPILKIIEVYGPEEYIDTARDLIESSTGKDMST